jgi:uncharacterized protein YhbP (UPF0306 family)
MDETIKFFLQHQSVVTICCTEEDGSPYCFPCFFAFNAAQGLLYFKSSSKSHHATLLSKNPEIAGSILPDKLNVLQLKGVQFEGKILPSGHELQQRSSINYYSKYPQALLIPGDIYVIQLTNIKMTDGAKGFGKKITWQRQVA